MDIHERGQRSVYKEMRVHISREHKEGGKRCSKPKLVAITLELA